MKEMNLPPQEFQDQITYLGGINRYDQPNFILWWSQYGHGEGSFRAGGVWSVDEQYYLGYRDLLRGSGEPCWTLGQWHGPEEYGTPEQYYVLNHDETTGLQTLGEYPYFGRYEVLYNLRWHTMEDDKLTFHTLPLNTTTFDAIVPIILSARDISIERRKAAWLAAREQEEKEKLGDIERHLIDKALPFTGQISYTRQGIRSTIIDQKVLAMQRNWSQITANARAMRPGMTTKNL